MDSKELELIASDDELRDAAYNLELPDYMYGTVVPEKEFFIKLKNE